MNTYGHTVCPDCTAYNSLYRPIKYLWGVWDNVKCWNCGKEYKHTDILPKTEADICRQSGRY